MSGPTRQRSFRERLHGIGIPWQGKKSKSYHSKDGQTLAESDAKPGVQDSRSCDPIPSCEDVALDVSAAEQAKRDRPKSTPPPPVAVLEEAEKVEEKPATPKDAPSHLEKRLLNRSFTQPKGTEEYKVKASDTLERIAARFDTTPSELAKLNRLTTRMIFPGQMLFVPEKRTPSGGIESAESVDSADDMKSNEGEKMAPSDSQNGRENHKSAALTDGETVSSRRKVSVTDALRIPYRRHSDRMQRFMKVKARHFTDGQGVVAGVLIITPNAMMFDPNVSDPLVIEHGIESYGVIAPLDMVMRTAIYFDIAHMKVKNAPETQLNIPKPDVYYGKMNNSCAEQAPQTLKATTNEPQPNNEAPQKTQEAEEKEHVPKETESVPKCEEARDSVKAGEPPSGEADKEGLSRDGSLDKEVSEAFSEGPKSRALSESSSTGSPTPSHPLSQQSSAEEKPAPESRRERMLKRLSYPMESITSYTQSSISRILSSSPKSFVDGLFVRSSEEDKGAPIPAVAETAESPSREERTQEPVAPAPSPVPGAKAEQEENKPEAEEGDKAPPPPETKEPVTVGYKNLVNEKPEVFDILDKLLKRNKDQEQEGPPLYLCLRMGHPKEKKPQCTPILSYGKKKAKSEYWFSIPHSRVEDLYHFLQQWFPHLYGEVDEADPEQLGFDAIDDSAEEEEEEEEAAEEEEASGEPEAQERPRSFLKLVEDHFGFRSISPTDWEVLSMSESEKISYEDYELPIPELLSPSDIFQEEHIKELYNLLPARAVGYPWTLLFSTSQHGFNLKTLYRKMTDYDAPVLLAIQDTEGSIFGSLISSPLRQSDHFYGNGESFLYTFYPEFKLYKWTGDNMYFAKGDVNSIAIGAGDGQFGLWIDGDLNHGRSQRCLTFDNDILCKNEDFIISSLEVWGFV